MTLQSKSSLTTQQRSVSSGRSTISQDSEIRTLKLVQTPQVRRKKHASGNLLACLGFTRKICSKALPISNTLKSQLCLSVKVHSQEESAEASPKKCSISTNLQSAEKNNIADVMMQSSGKETLLHMRSIQGRSFTKGCLANHSCTASFRAQIVDWMGEVLRLFELDKTSRALVTTTFDRFLFAAPTQTDKHTLGLVSTVCLSLASKFNDSSKGLILQTLYEDIGNGRFTKEEIINKELEVLQVLSYKLEVATPLDFLLFYMALSDKNGKLSNITELGTFLAGVNTLDYEMCGIAPSLQAASCILLATKIHEHQNGRVVSNDKTLASMSRLSTYPIEEIQRVAILTENNVRFFCEKFPLSKFFLKEHKHTFEMICSVKLPFI